MLELKGITKEYNTGGIKVNALKGINLKFRESEFVSILGASGCGKTTLLNIIGGLDRYTFGDLIINGKSTKKFKDRDWDAYRNYKVGFVFQSYNLIGHQTILSNVELALTIGGFSKKERRERAIKALEEVGLKEHIHKKPNQLSGGQMQRVAIARALVNDPDIILADEPTGALDTKTSVQVMEILKNIAKNKLIIMVTHNPDLAQKYSSRIIRILDGVITEDSNPISKDEEIQSKHTKEMGRTSMNFLTALRLSLNNLLTKKGRTILVAFAGSIGIIGIALVQAVSNGFQGYVDHIQEETLTSYPLTIMQESTDVASALLSMTSEENNSDGETNGVKEEQYITKMLDSLSTNDLRSFKKYYEEHNDEIKDDISSVKYSYSVEPMIYAVDATKKIAKLNPNNLFSSSLGSYNVMSSMSSTYSQMMDDMETLNNSYDILAGKWPEKYDEMVIVLSDRNTISDYLIYSLGLRDTDELSNIVSKIMNGEKVNIKNDPMNLTYEDLMNIELKLIMPSETYKYNKKYKIYEDMTADEDYMKELYEKSTKLKIVGVVTAKEGVTSMALNPGVAYTSDLINYIIDNSKETEIVKKQLKDEDVDVLSGNRFDDKKSKLDLDFEDMIEIDTEQLQDAFNIKIDQKDLENQTKGYMEQISNAITTDITPAQKDFSNDFDTLANGLFKNLDNEFETKDIEKIVTNYLKGKEATKIINSLENKYVIPKDAFKKTYEGLLKGLLQIYTNSYLAANSAIANSSTITENTKDINSIVNSTGIDQSQLANMDENTIAQMKEQAQKALEEAQKQAQNKTQNQDSNKNLKVKPDKEMWQAVLKGYTNSTAIEKTEQTMAQAMTEAVMKKTVLTKVAELTGNLTNSFASAFNVDQEKIAGAFKMKLTEDEIARIVTAMLTDTETSAKINLIKFGYQEKEEPTYISYYFRSFDGKEHFKDFINTYNEKVKENGENDKEINYTDTTGILMGSVKTIVNAVTYVLIAFISISLVVSSIMIGIITYISVYERTKEIGILRAIGASKHNISSIFNAETFIIGLLSGLFGIGVTYALIPIINAILHHFTGNIPLNATFYFNNALALIALSVVLTLIGGLIPARAASKKDPVEALRTE